MVIGNTVLFFNAYPENPRVHLNWFSKIHGFNYPLNTLTPRRLCFWRIFFAYFFNSRKDQKKKTTLKTLLVCKRVSGNSFTFLFSKVIHYILKIWPEKVFPKFTRTCTIHNTIYEKITYHSLIFASPKISWGLGLKIYCNLTDWSSSSSSENGLAFS